MLGEECARVRIREGKGEVVEEVGGVEEEDCVEGNEMDVEKDGTEEEKCSVDEVVDMFCVAKI
jgi:hypothetical protein